jgi:hypothetical protein
MPLPAPVTKADLPETEKAGMTNYAHEVMVSERGWSGGSASITEFEF